MAPKNKPDAATLTLAADTLSGDITSFLVDRLRQAEVAYIYLKEDEQQKVIADARKAAEYLVKETVAIIAGEGQETIPVMIKTVSNNGTAIKATIEGTTVNRHRHALFDAAGYAGHLIVSDSERFEGGHAPAPDPDQKELPDPGDGDPQKT